MIVMDSPKATLLLIGDLAARGKADDSVDNYDSIIQLAGASVKTIELIERQTDTTLIGIARDLWEMPKEEFTDEDVVTLAKEVKFKFEQTELADDQVRGYLANLPPPLKYQYATALAVSKIIIMKGEQ